MRQGVKGSPVDVPVPRKRSCNGESLVGTEGDDMARRMSPRSKREESWVKINRNELGQIQIFVAVTKRMP